MSDQSPFSKIKFEYYGNHLYFIKKDDLQVLEGDVPIIIYGPRGTGNTTLLNALNWKEHESNHSLVNTLETIGGRRDYLGSASSHNLGFKSHTSIVVGIVGLF
jgi:ABC-type lipoprotein export system ATPase subunit